MNLPLKTPRRKTEGNNPRKSSLVKILILSARFSFTLLIISIGLYIYSLKKAGSLPSESELLVEARNNPIQFPTTESDFSFTYAGTYYHISPQASYELNGLVVSHNNILAWGDIYHDENSVDLKDLCVIWGNNLDNEIYKKMKFYNESVSCHVKIDDHEAYSKFRNQNLSNNHLLSSDPIIREKIIKTRVGDQIKLKGFLVNYFPKNNPDLVRRSSTIRTDTGGGACEVIFVTEYDLLKEAPRLWFIIQENVKTLIFYCLIINITLFIINPWLDYKLN